MQIRIKVGMGEGGVTINRENEGTVKVGQPAGLPIPYANKDKSGDVERGVLKI